MKSAKNKAELQDRLLRGKVVNIRTGCWIWTGNFGIGGYGAMRFMGRMMKVHRLSMYAFSNMPFDCPELVLHRCDNPPCFNPEHLYRGDHKTNAKDAMERGQVKRGSAQGLAKFDEQIVKKIREEYRTGMTLKALGLKYGVSSSGTILPLLRRQTWRHVQ